MVDVSFKGARNFSVKISRKRNSAGSTMSAHPLKMRLRVVVPKDMCLFQAEDDGLFAIKHQLRLDSKMNNRHEYISEVTTRIILATSALIPHR